MTKKTYGRAKFSSIGWRSALTLNALLVASTLACAAALARGAEVNTIQSIKTTQLGIEIELRSTREFLQSDLPVLRVGGQEFTLSRYPEDGDLKTLIFMLTSDEFNKLASGERVKFQYGRGERNSGRDFGRLDKNMKDRRVKRSK